MSNFGSSFKTPYDIIADAIEKWCQNNYYASFIVTLRINGELCTEYLIYETGDPDRLDPHWVWESDWWEGQKDIELVGFIDMGSVYISGTPDSYKFITMDETLKTEKRVKSTAETRQKKPKDDDISTYQEYSYMRHPDRVEMGTY